MDVHVENRVLKILVLFLSVLLLTGLLGCSNLSEYERADRDIVTREQYHMCLAAFRAAGRPWYATRTRSAFDVKLNRPPSPEGMRQEMRENGCRP
jgi:hypothetical protein